MKRPTVPAPFPHAPRSYPFRRGGTLGGAVAMLAALAACAPRPPTAASSSGMISDGAAAPPSPAADAGKPPEGGADRAADDLAQIGPTLADAAAPAAPGGGYAQPLAEITSDSAGADAESETLWRADGRPVWWLTGPAIEGTRVLVTAEAMADSVVLARRRAIDAARRALAAAAPQGRSRETVDALLVRALPADAPGRARYVAYARVSAAPRTPPIAPP